MLLLSIPATVGLIMLRDNIVRLLYQGNAFTNDSAALVSWALLWYAAGLAGHGLVEILSRAFYSLHDTKTPVVVGVGAMTANLLLSLPSRTFLPVWDGCRTAVWRLPIQPRPL